MVHPFRLHRNVLEITLSGNARTDTEPFFEHLVSSYA